MGAWPSVDLEQELGSPLPLLSADQRGLASTARLASVPSSGSRLAVVERRRRAPTRYMLIRPSLLLHSCKTEHPYPNVSVRI